MQCDEHRRGIGKRFFNRLTSMLWSRKPPTASLRERADSVNGCWSNRYDVPIDPKFVPEPAVEVKLVDEATQRRISQLVHQKRAEDEERDRQSRLQQRREALSSQTLGNISQTLDTCTISPIRGSPGASFSEAEGVLPESSRKIKEQSETSAKYLSGDYFSKFVTKDQESTKKITSALMTARQAVDQRQAQRQQYIAKYRALYNADLDAPLLAKLYDRPLHPAEEVEEEEKEPTAVGVVRQPPEDELDTFYYDQIDAKSMTEPLVDRFDLQIKRTDLETLEGLNWLNDEIINFYFNLIVQRAQAHDNYANVYVFSTFFYKKLIQPNSFRMLKRWTRKVDIFR